MLKIFQLIVTNIILCMFYCELTAGVIGQGCVLLHGTWSPLLLPGGPYLSNFRQICIFILDILQTIVFVSETYTLHGNASKYSVLIGWDQF